MFLTGPKEDLVQLADEIAHLVIGELGLQPVSTFNLTHKMV